MFKTATYTQRRTRLQEKIQSGLILIMGNHEVGMNYTANTYRFRQDSNFLYFFGLDMPALAGVIDIDNNKTIIFGNELTMEDIVWEGSKPALSDLAQQVGVAETQPFSQLGKALKAAKEAGRTIHFLPPYRHDNIIRLHEYLSIPLKAVKQEASVDLIKAVVAQRSIKSAEEIAEMEKAVNVSRAMHHAVIRAAQAGKTEAELTGIARGISVAFQGNLAYPIILSVDGQTLHNHHHSNTLKTNQLVLADMGAETPMHYAGDITRTCPTDAQFNTRQKDIYNIVLKAEMDCIAALKPGIPYQQIHLQAARIIANGLKELGLMKGNTEEAVAQGAHALFFPHGLGHHIGLDVHDMEDLGEDYVGYSDTVKRSTQFGTAYLRLGRELEAGFVLTVEPGIYFIPELIDMWRSENKFTDFINYDQLDAYKNFGGIRIEDNVLVTADGPRILGKSIAKTIAEVEALRS